MNQGQDDRRPEDASPAEEGASSEAVSGSCLFCGHATYGVHCKVHCPNCGYREDCSDLFRV